MYRYTGRRFHHHHRRRGASYVFVLGTGMVVMVMGLSTLMMVRIQRRSNEGSNDLTAARFYAQSAIEYGFAKINQDPDWRMNLGAGPWATDQPIGRGTFSLEAAFVDDGDADASNDPVTLIGSGVSGEAMHRTQVTLIPQGVVVVVSPGSWKQVVN